MPCSHGKAVLGVMIFLPLDLLKKKILSTLMKQAGMPADPPEETATLRRSAR
ncbi:Hypothetical protein HEAR0297 [Herminiimonas arsenicoxydans]|uniref:Uncharacterized protein n=1 Tax=Herminiimonas arsenicoxydans TaxID=204773 RepID=A4G1Y7_HERAR|nr:Hypothetical protein HEAR0297 [Herminiimonas arsenicoxydans]